MTKQEALILIGADEFDFEEIVIQKIFEHKQFLLKSSITPQVFRTRARKISTLNDAFKYLKGESNLAKENAELDSLSIKEPTTHGFINFYRTYETFMSRFKLSLMQQNDPYEVSYYCNQLAELEHQKLLKLNKATSGIQINTLEEVKISDFINSGEIIKELKQLENIQINKQNIINFPCLIKDICRSRKYANFTELKK